MRLFTIQPVLTRSRFLACRIVLVSAFYGAAVGNASASTATAARDAYLADHATQVRNITYAGGAIESIPTMTEAEYAVLNAQRGLTDRTITQEIAQVATKARVLPTREIAATALGRTMWGATAFQVGWKIGSGVNAKWLHLNGDGVAHSTRPSDYNQNYCNTWQVATTTYADGITPVPATGGFNWAWYKGDCPASFSDLPGCCMNGDQKTWWWGPTTYWPYPPDVPGTQVQNGSWMYGHISFEDLLATADTQVTPYTGQAVNVSTGFATDPGAAAVESGALDALKLPANTDYADWLARHLAAANGDPDPSLVKVPDCIGVDPNTCVTSLEAAGLQGSVSTLPESDLSVPDGKVVETEPEDYAEPDTTVAIAKNPDLPTGIKTEQRCDPNDPPVTPTDPGEAPADGTGYPAYQEVKRSPYPGIDPTASPATAASIPLRWGTTAFGWRHILTGVNPHPYSDADEVQTMEALATDSQPERGWPSRPQWIFHKHFAVPDGQGGQLECVRSVVVEYYTDKGAVAAGLSGIRGVMNSYVGEYVGGSP